MSDNLIFKLKNDSFPYHIIVGEKGSGKSIFLKNVKSYFEEQNFIVVYLDFSDFTERTYSQAIKYFSEKMRGLYYDFYHYFLDDCKADYIRTKIYLDILEQKIKKDTVKCSLSNLLCIYEESKRSSEPPRKLALLIDNISQTELYARKFGYDQKMCKFIRAFLGQEYLIRYCDFYLQVGDYFLGRESRNCESYTCQDIFPNEIDFWQFDDYFTNILAANKGKNDLLEKDILDKRKWIKTESQKNEENRKLAEIAEKEKYAKPLSRTFIRSFQFLSPMIGITSYRIAEKNQNESYKNLNDYLKSLYIEYVKSGKKSDFVYEKLQEIDFNENTDWDASYMANVEETSMRFKESYPKYWSNDDGYWSYFGFKDKENKSYNCSSMIKMYVTFCTPSIKDKFLESILFLLENGKNSFAAKISKLTRNDQLCYWVYKNEYNLLQQFFSNYKEQLVTPMPFIAYENKIGISHEMNLNSHNSLNSEIIRKYFDYIKSENEISLSKMYSLFVAGWNYKTGKKNPFTYFKSSYADELIVIISTINILLQNEKTKKDAIDLILSDDKNLWSALSRSPCWSDFEHEYAMKIDY